jgi:hypothetical protein
MHFRGNGVDGPSAALQRSFIECFASTAPAGVAPARVSPTARPSFSGAVAKVGAKTDCDGEGRKASARTSSSSQSARLSRTGLVRALANREYVTPTTALR